MKTRLILASLLLLAFGTAKAQDTITVLRNADTLQVVMPDMSQFNEIMRDLGTNLQQLSDSVDWEQFERDMEKWGAEMEKWGRKMEKWGEGFEKKYGDPNRYQPLKGSDKEVRAIQVIGSGDVHIQQDPGKFSVVCNGWEDSNYVVNDGMLSLGGSDDRVVTMQQLDKVVMVSSGDVYGIGTLRGGNLDIKVFGSGDLRMDVDYDTIWVQISGSGDVTLKGKCDVIYAELTGSGDLKGGAIECRQAFVKATGTGKAWTNKSGDTVYREYHRERTSPRRGHLFNASWNGFEAGLNMLFSVPKDGVYTAGVGTQGLELKPMRSWYFGFNIADVGVAFDKKHIAGLFTGVGIGWNNFSWSNDVTVEFDPTIAANTLVPIEADQVVKVSKYGALFLQVPLMVEVRPTRDMYINAGVTGGLRFAQWNRVKLADGTRIKRYHDAGVNRFKLDASFRIGYNYLGFFANYALLPFFDFELPNSKMHPLTFGLSVNF